MAKGFVLGKFLPFHTGHEELIRTARAHCDHLTILVCASTQEVISDQQRVKWIEATYRDPTIAVVGFTYDESILPNTSVSSREVSRIWAERLKKIVADVDLVITGETYGDYLAEFMGISHVRVQRDGDRSATAIRADIMKNWEMLNIHCRKDLVRKVTITGTESTGKSTLAQRLAHHFGTTYVAEAGRDIVSHTSSCTLEDLGLIAQAHSQRIEDSVTQARRLLFLDTDIYTTASYSRFLFQRELEIDPHMRETNRADLTLYLDSEAPYVQDGTRLDKPDRDALDRSHRAVLDQENISYRVLKGSYDERFVQAVAAVEALIPFESAKTAAEPDRRLVSAREHQ